MKNADAQASTLTSMRCGGRIAQLLTIESEEEMLRLAGKLNDFIILGGGTNMIFADGLMMTPVIKLGDAFEYITIEDDRILAGAGAKTSAVLLACKSSGLTGIEFMAGIPGTIGGAVWMNAGTNDRGILDTVSYIDIIDASGKNRIEKKDISYGYRHAEIPAKAVITGVCLTLEQSSPEAVSAKIRSYLDKRRNQPGGASSGCIFKNPEGQSAGYLIDKAGLKGARVGGAVVSSVHANFIINDKSASASDVLKLIAQVKEEVKKQFSIELTEEVRIVA